MNPNTASRTRRIVNRISATWADLDYAQRRLLELRTGATGLTSQTEEIRPRRRPDLPGATR